MYVLVVYLDNLQGGFGTSTMINRFKLLHPWAPSCFSFVSKIYSCRKSQLKNINFLKDRRLCVCLQEKRQNLVNNVLKTPI